MLPRLWQVKKFLRQTNFRQRHFSSNAETVQGEASIAQNTLPFRPARLVKADFTILGRAFRASA